MRSLLWTRRRRRDASGVAAVEFAIIATVLITLLFGMIQYGLYFWSLQSGAAAVRETARRAAVGDLTCSELDADMLNLVQGEQPDTFNTTREFFKPDGTTSANPAEVGGVVEVSVTFDSIDLKFPFLPFIEDGAVFEAAAARVENVTSNSLDCS